MRKINLLLVPFLITLVCFMASCSKDEVLTEVETDIKDQKTLTEKVDVNQSTEIIGEVTNEEIQSLLELQNKIEINGSDESEDTRKEGVDSRTFGGHIAVNSPSRGKVSITGYGKGVLYYMHIDRQTSVTRSGISSIVQNYTNVASAMGRGTIFKTFNYAFLSSAVCGSPAGCVTTSYRHRAYLYAHRGGTWVRVKVVYF